MEKLVLIDGNSIANRAFYALPLLSNKQGIYTNAVYGFTQIVLKIIEEIKPTHFLVAFDAGKITFRHSDFKEYKGKRLKTPLELSGQFPMLRELLDTFQIKYYEIEGYEADDIIGTFAKKANEKELETIIYTGDKDMLQLASEHVTINLTRKGITEVEEYNPEKIYEKYQLTPAQIIDFKGLMGDSSDNIPGVPGVGEKTALKLLHQYSTVEQVLQNIDNISGKKLKENLTTYNEQAIMSKQLATIYQEVPMELNIGDLTYDTYDPEKVYPLFEKWEFQSLIERLGMQKNIVQVEKIELKTENFSNDNKEIWESIWEQKEKELSVHVEIDGDQSKNDILGIAISDGNGQLFLSYEELKNWDECLVWLKDPSSPKWVYDSKKLEMILFWHDIEIQGIQFDLLLGTYLLNPSDGTITIAEIAKQFDYQGLTDDDNIYGKGAKRSLPSIDVIVDHTSRKAHAIYTLVAKVEKKLVELNLQQLLFEVELPLARVLAMMEKQGVRIDIERLNNMGEEINQRLTELTEQIYELAGTEFNINSPKQLGEILFDKLQLPVIKKTKTGYSTSADVLEKLETQHEIIGYILHYRQLGKLYSTYIEGLSKVADHDTKKIHTTFNQAITATGRLSSTEPNLQNIPIRLEEGRLIRQAFIPSNSDWVILAADYSQVELRVLAHISNDENLVQAFQDDLDVHTKTAMDVFGVNADEVTSLMRRQAKAVNFGIVYGISDYGLSQNLNISRKEAAIFIEKYFAVFSGVQQYMKDIVEKAKNDGYVTTLLNRRRYLPEIRSSNFNLRSFAERTAMNTPIQGTAADIIKLAMIKVVEKMQEKKLTSKMLLQVHDELIFEVPPSEIEQMKELVKDTMEQALELNVPLKVDMNIGPTWYEAK